MQQTFRRQFRMEDRLGWIDAGANDDNPEFAPTIQDLPAIAILTGAGQDPWALNQVQELVYPLQVVMWFGDRSYLPAEKAIEDLIRALLNDDTGVNPIYETTGQYPRIDSHQIVQTKLADGTTRATLARVGVTLSASWHPQGV